MLSELTEMLLSAKQEKGLSFEQLGTLLGQSEVWVAALFYQQASASTEQAEKLLAALDLAPRSEERRVGKEC